MAWKTVAGTTAAAAGVTGLKEFATGDALTAALLNANWKDCQEPGHYALLPGVLAGGVCTASALAVTIPSGTYYYARSVWYADGAAVVNVTDDTTTAIWGCSDGEIRTSADASTFPTSYDGTNCCLLTLVTAAGGTATPDNTVQEKARTATATGRFVTEGELRATKLVGADTLSLGRANITGAKSDADYTLTAAQYRCRHIVCAWTGWTGPHNAVLPLVDGSEWVIVNLTGQALTAIGATGTGVAIASTKTAVVRGDGTNIARVTADV